MTTQKIYGARGEYMGYLNEDKDQIKAFNSRGKYVGFYIKATNRTFNANGMLSSQGNTVVSNIFTNTQ